MSWPELERLVMEAEASQELRQCLRRCRSREELLLAARHLGYRVTRIDLQNAWIAHRQAAAQQGWKPTRAQGMSTDRAGTARHQG